MVAPNSQQPLITPAHINLKKWPARTRFLIYARHSPGDNQTIDAQFTLLQEICRQAGWIVVDTFVDSGISGKSTKNRSEFQRMMKVVDKKPRVADVVLVVDYSRFARNEHDGPYYRYHIWDNGYEIISIQDDIPEGEFQVLHEVLIDIGHYRFLKVNGEKTKNGLRYIAGQGCVPGGEIIKGYKCTVITIGIKL